MEQHLKDLLSELLYKCASAAYDHNYSSQSYMFEIDNYKAMISSLITLAEKSGVDISEVESSYCGWSYKACDFLNYEELTKYW